MAFCLEMTFDVASAAADDDDDDDDDDDTDHLEGTHHDVSWTIAEAPWSAWALPYFP